ncbi:MAG: tRNA lysidine(34) synthetase TilS [Ornithinimicrobium sp.]
MTGPPPAVAAARSAVRSILSGHGLLGRHVLVACSGGADSVALALAAQFVVPRHGGTVGAAVVDHRLQPGSRQVAGQAAEHCRSLGIDPVEVVSVDVRSTSGGIEDAAREARYAALSEVAVRTGARAVLVAHTSNDQAEQVMLGLARGSGTRSLSGMPSVRPLAPDQCGRGQGAADRSGPLLLVRPFLGLGREVTEQVCAEAGLTPWQDPQNQDPRFTRVRARRLLDRWDAELGPGVTEALTRSAELARVDADTLDQLSQEAYAAMGPTPWSVNSLLAHPAGIRIRLLKAMVLAGGAQRGALGSVHLRALDDLVVRWRGQGPVDLPGLVSAYRKHDRIWLRPSIPS